MPTLRPTPALTSVPSADEGAGSASSGGGCSPSSASLAHIFAGVGTGAALRILGVFLLATMRRRSPIETRRASSDEIRFGSLEGTERVHFGPIELGHSAPPYRPSSWRRQVSNKWPDSR